MAWIRYTMPVSDIEALIDKIYCKERAYFDLAFDACIAAFPSSFPTIEWANKRAHLGNQQRH